MLHYGLDQQSEAEALIRYLPISYNNVFVPINHVYRSTGSYRRNHSLSKFFFFFLWIRETVVEYTDLIVQNGLSRWRYNKTFGLIHNYKILGLNIFFLYHRVSLISYIAGLHEPRDNLCTSIRQFR